MRVLYVDDEDGLRTVFEHLCRHRGFEIHCAESYDAAAQVWGQHRFDAVVTDVQMARGSGLELSRWLRAQDSDIPIFLFTGTCDYLDPAECGATAFFSKAQGFDFLMAALTAVHLGTPVVEPPAVA